MKLVLLSLIKIYWKFIPESRRRRCLFKKSCSQYVYENTINNGLFSGIRALKFRVYNCNSHYNIIELNGEKILITKTNETFKEKELNKSILN